MNMKAVYLAFRQFLSGVWDDFMLAACLFAPILMGVMFRFGLPVLEMFLCSQFAKAEILAPYYSIFDLSLIMMTPVMFSFAGVMTVLEETDNGTAQYLIVTPLGKTGYIASRIGVPTALAVVYSIVALLIFGLSKMNFGKIIVLSVLCASIGIIVSMLVIAFAKNKVEGMALVKLSGILLAGIPIAFFIPSPIGYIGGVLPSYWISKLTQTGNYLFAFPAISSAVLWMILLNKRFERKLL